jgi:hypothetical protein
MKHVIDQVKSPIHFKVFCSCGWSFQTTRKQNAWARAAKIRAAIKAHEEKHK